MKMMARLTQIRAVPYCASRYVGVHPVGAQRRAARLDRVEHHRENGMRAEVRVPPHPERVAAAAYGVPDD